MAAENAASPSVAHSTAVRYATLLEWPVFPAHTTLPNGRCSCGKDCGRDCGKHPIGELVPRGFLDASNDPTIVDTWWARHPNANIGIPTGAESGVVVVDRDGGPEMIAAAEREYGPLPLNTPRSRTGSGGEHIVLAHPGRHVITKVKILSGVDSRGDGGYIIVPPSRHHSGNNYAWLPGLSPFEVDPAPIPDGWLSLLCPERKTRPAARPNGVGDFRLTADQLAALVAIIGPHYAEGIRHDLSVALAGWLGMQGYVEDAAWSLIDHLATGDPERAARLRNVTTTFDRLANGEIVVGWQRLKELLPEQTLKVIEGIAGTNPRIVRGPHRMGSNGSTPPPDPPEDEFFDTDAGDDMPPPPSDRPGIDAGNQDLEITSALAWNALKQANIPERLFRFGLDPVRIQRSEDDATPLPQRLTEDRLSHELARVATWYRQDKEGRIRTVAPPPRVIKDMLAAPEIPLPPLRSIVSIPVFAPDGTLQTDPGYHPAGRSYYAPDRGFRALPVPTSPTATDLERAKSLILDDLLGDFPFIGEAERANAIALFLDRFLRDLIDGPTPLRLIEAPMAGSGKGLLAEVLLQPTLGPRIHLMPAATDEAEWQKRLTAQLELMPGAITIDNVTKALDSGALALALTAGHWTNRRLGTNDMVAIPVRCAWIATANNPSMSTEIARRTVRIRLDPKVDRPWQRTGFRHTDLRSWARDHRDDLVWAGHVLIQHWLVEGRPAGTIKIGSFERWSAVLGGVLGTADIEGHLGNLESFYESADLEGAVWRQFVAMWFETHGESEVGASDLFSIATQVEGLDLGKGTERSQRVTFGTMLTQQRDRVIGDLRIINTRTVNRLKRWRLIKARSGANPFAAFYEEENQS